MEARMLRTVVGGGLGLVLWVGPSGEARADTAPSPCDAVKEHRHDTVIVLRPPSTFTICHDGSPSEAVVTGRPVYFEVVPTPASRMFDFRIHGQAHPWAPVGLSVWQDLATKIASKLRDLDHSGELIADIVVPLDAGSAPQSPLRPLATARTRYLADVTPRYLDALHSVYSEARELTVVSNVVRKWCGALGTEAPGALSGDVELAARCAGPELREGTMEQVIDDFEAAAKKESADRAHARDLALNAVAHPDDAAAVSEAVRALDAARLSSNAVVAAAHTLRESSTALARDVATLRVTLRSMDSIRPGAVTYLTTYSNAGNAELEVDTSPADLSALTSGDVPTHAGSATGRFPVYGRHYIDIEAGVGWTGGVPNVPFDNKVNGVETIQTRPVNEFVGLAMIELEPLRFLWPERPIAGVLRLPTLSIPFTRDPTQNFFIGGGLGWTGVGSLNFGPYFLRETTLRPGFVPNQQLPSGTGIAAATVANLEVGYYLSASVDLLGLVHLFWQPHTPTIDAVSGKEK
jgi:hypothetical protein